MNRAVQGGAAAGLAVLIAVGAWTLGASSGDDDAPATTTTTGPPIAVDGELDEGASELGGLLANGRSGTWHATYAVTPPGAAADEGEELEVWRSGARVREDSVVGSGAEAVHTVGIRDGDRNVRCQRRGSAPWACAPIEAGELAQGDLLAALVGELAGQTVTPRDDTVGGEPARCFAIGATDLGEMCVSAEGIPLRIARGGATIELVHLERAVDDSVFQPPA